MSRENIEEQRSVTVNDSVFDRDIYFDIIQNLFDDMLFSLNLKTKELRYNSEVGMKFGLPKRVKNFPMSMVDEGVIYPDDLSTFMAYSYDMLLGNSGSHEVRIRGNDGMYYWVAVKTTVLKNPNGEVVEVLGRVTNIQNQKDVQVRAMTDALTKTQNRLTFEENVNFIISNSTEEDEHAFFFIDLDDFKCINDTYGHRFGDFVLTSLADRIKNRVQKGDLVGRVGGDEFVVFMKGISGFETIEKRANQLLNDLRMEYSDGEHAYEMKVSIGVSRYPHDAKKYVDLYDIADKALYNSKRSGKDIVTVYRDDI